MLCLWRVYLALFPGNFFWESKFFPGTPFSFPLITPLARRQASNGSQSNLASRPNPIRCFRSSCIICVHGLVIYPPPSRPPSVVGPPSSLPLCAHSFTVAGIFFCVTIVVSCYGQKAGTTIACMQAGRPFFCFCNPTCACSN